MSISGATYVLRRLEQVVTFADGPIGGRVTVDHLGIREHAAVVVHRGRIAWIGPDTDIPAEWAQKPTVEIDLRGHIALPGLIDPHTHLVYGGDRLQDWLERLRGRSYAEIAARGGGIVRTVRDTRAMPEDDLLQLLEHRLDRLFAFGVTTVEIKTGYGLDAETELRLLRCLQRIQDIHPMTVIPTFLGAHAIPPDMDRTAYIDMLAAQLIPVVAQHRLALTMDVFCDAGYFTPEETLFLLEIARQHGFTGFHLHVDEFSHTGLLEAIDNWKHIYSVDHLNHMDGRMAAVLAEQGAAAVLSPATALHLQLPRPPISALLDAGVHLAFASDHNPGTNPVLNPWYTLWVACVHWGLPLEQVLAGMTVEAAYSLRIHGQTGRLSPRMRADMVIVDVPHYGYILYQWDTLPIRWVWKNGRPYRIREQAEIHFTWMALEE